MTSIDDEDRLQIRRTFASFKLRVIEGMTVDRRLGHSDVRVGLALLSFMNRDTGALFPSIALLGEITGLSEKSVRTCLAELKASGWLSWHRGNRQRPNQYAFEIDNLEPMAAQRKQIMERCKGAKRVGKAPPDRKQATGQRGKLTGSRLPLQTGSRLPPNTVMEHGSKKGAA